MTWTAIRWAERATSPWPNGRGITRDFWEGAGWRATLAELTEDAPFSALPGVARIFTLLDGAVELTTDGAPVRAEALRPVRFGGGASTSLRLLGGPTQAFNVFHDPGLHDPGLHDPGLHDPGLDDPGLNDPGSNNLGRAIEVAERRDWMAGPGEHLAFMLASGRVDALLLGPRDAAHGHGAARIEGHAIVVSVLAA